MLLTVTSTWIEKGGWYVLFYVCYVCYFRLIFTWNNNCFPQIRRGLFIEIMPVHCTNMLKSFSKFLFYFLRLHLRGDEEMLWVLALHCCKKRCLRQLSIDDERYTEARKQTGKQNYFLEVLHQQSHRNESGEYETEFYV